MMIRVRRRLSGPGSTLPALAAVAVTPLLSGVLSRLVYKFSDGAVGVLPPFAPAVHRARGLLPVGLLR